MTGARAHMTGAARAYMIRADGTGVTGTIMIRSPFTKELPNSNPSCSRNPACRNGLLSDVSVSYRLVGSYTGVQYEEVLGRFNTG